MDGQFTSHAVQFGFPYLTQAVVIAVRQTKDPSLMREGTECGKEKHTFIVGMSNDKDGNGRR
jgi:hypothetical protein